MSSLVLELQRESMDPNVPVSSILRKALVVATKLDVPEFRAFCENELRGYGEHDTAPEYRRIRGELSVWNPYRGWQPVLCENPECARRISEAQVGPSIAELEDLVSRNDERGGALGMPIQPELLSQWSDEDFMQLGLMPRLLVSRTAICGIIEKVRDLVLEWSLKLEREGILGEGMTFSEEERQAAASVVFNIASVMGGIVGGSVSANNLEITSFSSIHAELKRLNISQESRHELESIMDELPEAPAEEKPALLQRGLDWVARNKEALGTLSQILSTWMRSQT